MKKINIYLILILFNYINLQERKIGNMTVDEFVKTVNSINLSENDYKAIIKSISNLIDKYYVYSEIAKNPGIIKGVDLIKELNEIDTKNIKYLDFYNKVQEIIYKTRDGHFNVVFYNISKYTYYLPIQFDIKTKGTIGLYAKLDEKNKKYHDFFDKRNLEIVNKNQNVKIKWISNSDPINYLMNNHFSLYKDEHAQFSSDLEEISKSSIFIPFYENKFKNFIIEYDNGDKITFDYKILYVIENKKLFLKFYEDEFLKNIHNNVLLKNTIIDYENLYLTKKGKNPNRNLLDSSWKNFNNKILYKIDSKYNVSVIVQKTFSFEETDAVNFFLNMNDDLANAKYPIIIIQSMNGGGYVHYALILQRILNFYSGNREVISSFKVNERNKNLINTQKVTDIETCGMEKVFSNKKIYTEKFGNVIHNRTSFYRLFNTYIMVDFFFSQGQHIDRKPTEIIVFTDGFSFSATSLFIKDLQETGNAIIVGYNGIPSEERKKDKFNGSQSPTTVLSLDQSFPKDPDVKILKKYNIYMRTSFGATYNYTYQNKHILHIPREYTINPIDERSNIFGRYDDSKYDDFVKYGLGIIKKYKTECNKDNKRLLLKNDSCKFENDANLRGGNVCGDDGKWNLEKCEPYYCVDGYLFDPYNKKCLKDACYNKFVKYIVLVILILILFVIIIIFSIWLCCRYCECCKRCCPCCSCYKKQMIYESSFEAPLISPGHY